MLTEGTADIAFFLLRNPIDEQAIGSSSRIVELNKPGSNLMETLQACCQNNVAGITFSISAFISQHLLENKLYFLHFLALQLLCLHQILTSVIESISGESLR